jgi:hypothetical protein
MGYFLRGFVVLRFALYLVAGSETLLFSASFLT